jgi:hypothetical protein
MPQVSLVFVFTTESAYGYFLKEERLLFESFVTICEKLAFTAYDRLREKESLEVLKGISRKGGFLRLKIDV